MRFILADWIQKDVPNIQLTGINFTEIKKHFLEKKVVNFPVEVIFND